MGAELTASPRNTNDNIKEYFDELSAYAYAIGMTYNQFWFEDVCLLNIYLKSEAIKTKKRNQELWLQGYYVYLAVGSLAPVLNGLSKDHKARPYIKQPIPLSEEERQEQLEAKITSTFNSLVGKKPKQ